MKVRELIELLKTCLDDEEVVVFMKGKIVSPISDLSRDIYRPIQKKVEVGDICDTCEKIWHEIECKPSPSTSGNLVDYERNRQEGDLDVVTLWPVN